MRGSEKALARKRTCSLECMQKMRLNASKASKPCEVCGAAIVGYLSDVTKKRFCSRACFTKSVESKLSFPCQICGVSIQGAPSVRRKTCGPECFAKLMDKKVSMKCEGCGKSFALPASQMKNRKCCSKACSNHVRKANVLPCCICGNPTYQAPRNQTKDLTCSRECYHKLRESQAHSKPCEVCGEPIKGQPSHIRKLKTCSAECLRKLRIKEQVSKPCCVCGKEMVGTKSRMLVQRTCGTECLKKLQSGVKKRKPSKKPTDLFKLQGKAKAVIVADLMQKQNGKCACCGKLSEYGIGGLFLDHCHTSGEARGLLCAHCNTALGMMADSPDRIMCLLNYAKRHKQLKLVAS